MKLRKSFCVFMLLALVWNSRIQHQDLHYGYFGDQSAHPYFIKHLFASEQNPLHPILIMFILSSVSVVILTVLLTVRSGGLMLVMACRCCQHALLLSLSSPGVSSIISSSCQLSIAARLLHILLDCFNSQCIMFHTLLVCFACQTLMSKIKHIVV